MPGTIEPAGGSTPAGRREAAIQSEFRMAATTLSMKASADMLGVFQNWAMASCIAPVKFGVEISSWASTWLAGFFTTALDFWAQASMLDTSTSKRTGIDPFFLLNSSWVVGSSRASASLSCAASVALSFVDREHEHVAADDHPAAAFAHEHAVVLLAGRLAGRGELALGPIAVEVHGGLVGDHQGGRVVPVPARAAGIDERPHLAVDLDHFLELGALRGGLVAAAQDLAEEIRAAMTHEHGVEQVALPGGLPAQGDRNDSLGLELLARREELGEGLGRLDAGVRENLGVVEHPVLAVDVDRNGVELAVAHGRLDDRLRHQLAPLAGLRLLLDVPQEIVADELVELLAGVELRHRGRVAAHDAVDGGCAGIHAARDGGVDPGPAALGVLVGEHPDRGGFSGRRPPVHHLGLGLLRERARARKERDGEGVRGRVCLEAHGFLPEAIELAFVLG